MKGDKSAIKRKQREDLLGNSPKDPVDGPKLQNGRYGLK
jgi:hypothetical protein